MFPKVREPGIDFNPEGFIRFIRSESYVHRLLVHGSLKLISLEPVEMYQSRSNHVILELDNFTESNLLVIWTTKSNNPS